jgi:hypothetical protein
VGLKPALSTQTGPLANSEIARTTFKRLLRSDWLWAILGHFLLTALFTFPLIFNFGKALPGVLLEDRDQNLWNLWWVPRALLRLKNPYHTDFIYYPDGVSLYFHTLHPLNGLISFPVQLLFGMTAAYNFIVFFSFIMGGLGGYLLLKYLCRQSGPAFVGSLIFTYAPYHMGTLKGVMQLISLEWLPFYILFLIKATREPERRRLNLALAVFFLVCTALIDWYYVLFLLMFTLLYLIYPHEKPYFPALKKRLWITGLIVGLFGLIMLPVLLPMLKELNQTSYYLPEENAALQFSAPLAAFFIPPTTSTFFGGIAQNFPAQYLTGPLAAQVYLGYVALLLALLGVKVSWTTRFWGVVFIVFWLLAFGPTLQLNGPNPGWPMPFSLIQNWPIIKITRSPDRFIVISMLALAVCASQALSNLRFTTTWPWAIDDLRFNKSTGRKDAEIIQDQSTVQSAKPSLKFVNDPGPRNRQSSMTQGHVIVNRQSLVFSILIVLEFLQIPFPVKDVAYSPFFERLGSETADYSIIELPAQGGFWSGAPRMANQTVHGKRIFNGYISREFDHPFVRRTPGFQELNLLKEQPDIFRPEKAAANLSGEQSWYDAFSYYKARYIVLYRPQTQKEKDTTDLLKNRQMIARVVQNAPPVYSDDLLEAYAVPELLPAQHHPFVQIGEGWYEAEPDESGGGRHRWARGQANLNILWQGPDEHSTRLSFNIGLLSGEQKMRITLDGGLFWQGTVSATQQRLELEAKLKPGPHRLDFYPDGQAQSPKELGISPNDTRKLLFYIGDLAVS